MAISFSWKMIQQALRSPPILVAVIGIVSMAFMLMIYHCIVMRWFNRGNVLRAPHGPPFSPGGETMHGLNKSFIRLIPAYKYGTEAPIDGGECVVCLCEFKEGDDVRRLPECLHNFHVPCIDMWFYSHSNCPICRTDVTPPPGPQEEVQLEASRLQNLGG